MSNIKYKEWLLNTIPYQYRNIVLTPQMEIGYMIEYLHMSGIKDFEFIDMNSFEIYDLLMDRINKLGGSND